MSGHKSIYRVLSQAILKINCPPLTGRVIDLASGGHSDYRYFLNLSKEAQYITSDIKKEEGVDIVLDLTQKLPFEDGSFDVVLLFNCLYIFENPEKVLKEIKRIVKPNGFLLALTPFVFNEIPEPADYWRFTGQGLAKILRQAGFKEIKIIPFGERFSAAVSLLNKFLIFNFLKPFIYWLAVQLDKTVPKNIKKNHPCPLGYLTIARKLSQPFYHHQPNNGADDFRGHSGQDNS